LPSQIDCILVVLSFKEVKSDAANKPSTVSEANGISSPEIYSHCSFILANNLPSELSHK